MSAKIHVHVTQFHPLPIKHNSPFAYSDCSLHVNPAHPRVTIISHPQLGPTVHVAGRQGLVLEFLLIPREGRRTLYQPIGIAFLQQQEESPLVGRDVIGAYVFPLRSRLLFPGGISVMDQKCVGLFKFTLLIQRVGDGALGLLDPGVEHDPVTLNNIWNDEPFDMDES